MSDDFTRDLFRWLDQVRADHDLHPTAFQIAYAISQHVNRRNGTAWPSLPTLAGAAGIGKRATIRIVKRLEANGHLKIERHRGRSKSNVYRLVIQPETGAEKGNAGSSFDDEKVSSSTPFSDDKRCRPAHEKVSSTTPKPSEEPREPLRALSGRETPPRRRAAGAAPPEVEQAFGNFWNQYPKRQGEQAARRAFAEIIADGAKPADIIAGAMRYAAAVTGKANRFIAMPANWLRDGRWTDEPSAENDNSGGQQHHRGGKPNPVDAMLRAGGVRRS